MLSKQHKLVGAYLEYYEPTYVGLDHLKGEWALAREVGINAEPYDIYSLICPTSWSLYQCHPFTPIAPFFVLSKTENTEVMFDVRRCINVVRLFTVLIQVCIRTGWTDSQLESNVTAMLHLVCG